MDSARSWQTPVPRSLADLAGGALARPRSRALRPWLVGAAVLALLMAFTAAQWARDREQAREQAETRAAHAEAELASTQATLTAVQQAQVAAAASATATARAPRDALEGALGLVLEAYREPSETRLAVLADVLSPSALAIFRPEAEHLAAAQLRLAPEARYELEVLDSHQGDGWALLRTREVWVYDERDARGQRARCLREESIQSYVLTQQLGRWGVNDFQLEDSKRTPC